MHIDAQPFRARNVVVFGIVSASAGWLGWGVNQALGLNDRTRNLGMLFFLLLPLLTALLLRAFGGDGWRDLGWKFNLRGNALGYGVALLGYPLLVGLLLVMGALGGGISFGRFSAVQAMGLGGAPALFVSFGTTFASNFVKNISEEFAWRGYLTPRLHASGLHDLLNHLLTGIIWASWHVPYWLFLLDRSTLADFTSLSLAVFIPSSLLNVIASAFLYGEVRLLTGSTLAVVFMHSIANAVVLWLLQNDFITVEPSTELWFTPGGNGLIGTGLVTLAGLGLYRHRTRQRA
jgi:membrane protease YdiL (CAAX protease family)